VGRNGLRIRANELNKRGLVLTRDRGLTLLLDRAAGSGTAQNVKQRRKKLGERFFNL